MDKSVAVDVKHLADCFSSNNKCLSRSEAKKLIFERLLSWKPCERTGLTNFMPLAHFSFFFRRRGLAEKADSLDAAVEKLYSFDGDFPVTELQLFLGALAYVDENQVFEHPGPHIFDFRRLSPLEISPSKHKPQVISYQKLRVPTIERLPPLPSIATDFPLLPSVCCDQLEKDEGFSSSNGSSPVPILCEQYPVPKLPPIREPVCKKPRPEQNISQLNTKDFDRLWNDLLTSGPYRLLSSQKFAESASVVVPFSEFKRCVHTLASGIGSWIFMRCGPTLVMESNVRIAGISMTAVRALLQPVLDLGNQISGMQEYINALEQIETHRQPTLRAFRLGLIGILRMYGLEISRLCDETSGLLDMVTKYGEYGVVFRQLTMLCGAVWNLLQHKQCTAKWLLDTLYDLCTEFRFSSRTQSFLLTLFEYALQPHLDLINTWMDDVDRALETTTDEFFIRIEKDAVHLNDRRFWTDALTLRKDQVPKVFSPFAKKILWMAKMTCLLHRLKVQSSMSMNEERAEFCLTKPSVERKCDSANEDTLIELVSGIQGVWQQSIDSMKRFINAKAIFGRTEFLNICANLRSVFLFADGDFSSMLVQKLFDEVPYNDQIDCPKDFFDLSSLNRALERALKSRTLSPGVNNLGLSFLVQIPTEKMAIDHLSVFDYLKLDCEIPWPTNIFLCEATLEWYQKSFGLLLKLDLTLWALSELRKDLLKLGSMENRLLYHRTLVQLREIDLFVRNLRTYLLHQVVDVSWASFRKKMMGLEDGQEFDLMFDMHNRYVSDFVNRCLLNPRSKKLLYVVEKLLKYAFDFGMAALSFSGEEVCRQPSFKDGLAEMMMKSEALHVNFTKALRLFYSVLSRLYSRGYQPHLADLLLRMNFNYHYENEQHSKHEVDASA